MFHNIPAPVLQRMEYLEELDREHRASGAPDAVRLKQVPRQTGEFLALLASLAPKGNFIEIGTSGGYSALWLSLACRTAGVRLTTFEVLMNKADLAAETFRIAQVEDVVRLVHGDAREYLSDCQDIVFCFLDAEKEMYHECYEKIVPNMVRGGILVCDNVISHKSILEPFVRHARQDRRVDAVVVPVGSGELVSVKR